MKTFDQYLEEIKNDIHTDTSAYSGSNLPLIPF